MSVYVHYGDKNFDKNKFDEIKNRMFVKPFGGLWASRMTATFCWKKWCESQRFRLDKYNENNCFEFKLKENAKVLVITESEQLKNLPQQNIEGLSNIFVCLDFEKLAEQYDAIEVLISEDYRLDDDLYGWDCDSILIMNKDVVEELYG